MIETIQERVRNMVGSFYNMKTLFKNIATEEDYEKRMKFVNYILDNSEQIYHTMDNSINYVTCGLGFKYKKFYCDLAYVYKHRSSDWHAFTPDPYSPELPSPQSKLTSDDHQIAVSMGIKF